ncbi:MAG: Sir2 family NAD-dependent protein deacetylase, partial [Anaerolineae bacterium]
MTAYDNVRIERHDQVAVVTLNRPDSLNAFSAGLRRDLLAAVEEVNTDPAIRVAVLTGAGVSAESGVPTFRGEEGIWRKFNPMELATYEAFSRNPKLVWEWYNYRRDIIRNIKPNPGHY